MSLTARLPGRTARGPRSLFGRIVSAAVAAGLLAGLALTAVQMVAVTPIILKAEVFEDAAAPAAPAVPAPAHAHADADAHGHHHEHAGWKPENGVERTLFTVLADITMGVACALLLCAALTLRGSRPSWRQGLLWGVAGYLAVFVAPSLGLPPELPGTSAAPLGERQLWWAMAAVATAGGMGLIAFGRSWLWALAGVLLLAAPQLVNAPQPLVHTSAAPEDLAHAFRLASAFTNAVFWLVLGSLAAVFYNKFE